MGAGDTSGALYTYLQTPEGQTATPRQRAVLAGMAINHPPATVELYRSLHGELNTAADPDFSAISEVAKKKCAE